nr:M15 family metallopeptidase [uncultured Draconibacterium sp.]
MKLSNKELAAVGLLSAALLIIAYKISNISNYVIMKVWDTVSDRRLKTLHPIVETQARIAINELDQQFGIKLRVTRARTDEKKQTALYNYPTDGIDNDNDGLIDEADEKVTNAQYWQTYHFYALALDVVEMKDGITPLWKNPNWDTIGAVFKKYGFEWGGDWPSPKTDKPHMQMSFGRHWSELWAMHQANQYKDGFLNLT